MHEFSIMSQVVQTVLIEAEKNNLKSISKVTLDVGELSFLGEESLKFCYQALIKDNILSDSELIINNIRPVVECKNCDHSGEIDFDDNSEFHFRMPIFTCPKCNGPVNVVKGKGCVIKEITGEIED